jgi:hypothetical protein
MQAKGSGASLNETNPGRTLTNHRAQPRSDGRAEQALEPARAEGGLVGEIAGIEGELPFEPHERQRMPGEASADADVGAVELPGGDRGQLRADLKAAIVGLRPQRARGKEGETEQAQKQSIQSHSILAKDRRLA